MMRWLTLLTAALVLTGCVTTREVVYREPYNADGYASQQPAYERQGGSYYAPAYSGQGDYYVGASYGSSYSYGISYFDYPAYYSVFWPLNRWYYDPYVHPGYYYGVTWFPRSYFSLGVSYGGSWRGHGWLSYSPYRYSWVDSYYDWRPWYDRYPSYRNHYPTPRYGDARVEASRLADLRRPVARNQYYGGGNRIQSNGAAMPASRGSRVNDSYGTSRNDVRRVGAGTQRATPRTGVFGNPTRGTSSSGGSRIQTVPRNQMSGSSTSLGGSRNEVERFSGQRALPTRGNAVAPANPRQSPRDTALPVTRMTPRAADTGIPMRGSQSRPQERERAPGVAPAPVRSAPVRGGVQSRPTVQDTLPVRGVAPVRETAPVRQALPVRSAPPQGRSVPQHQQYAPATPSAPAVRSVPTRNAPVTTAPSRAAPVTSVTPAPRSAPSQSRGESAVQRGNSSVRRTGSDRNR